MLIEIMSKNYKVSDRLRDVVEKKVAKLDKYFKDEAKVRAYFKNVKNTDTLELTVSYDNLYIRAQAEGADMFANIDAALPKIEKQIIKHKTKIHNKLKSDAFASKELVYNSAVAPEKEGEVVKVKTFDLPPISVEQAVVNMDLLSHNFYLFRNVKSGQIELVYLRGDGEIGHIQPSEKGTK